MAQNHGKGVPAYKRIQNTIRHSIECSELRVGDVVPSEREVARLYKVSLMTARQALAGLEREGLVERRRGAGTFVSPPKIHFNKLTSYTEHMSSWGLVPRTKVLTAKVVENEPEVAARLGLPANSPLIKIERLRLTGHEPFALEIGYVSAPEFPGLEHLPLHRVSLFSTLQQEYGLELAYADEEVDATAAVGSLAESLKISPGHPALRIRQVMYSTKGKPAIYGVGYYRSERHQLFIRRFR